MIVLLIFAQTGKYTTSSNIVKCADYDHPDDAITAIGASNKTLLITESETCDANFTVPTNITVKFERSGKWTINNGITVTFNGQIDAGLWQIFEYVGTGILAGTPIIKEVYPQKWATGDGTVENPWTNDCIQKAYDFVPAGGTIFLRAGYYQLAGQLTVSKKVNIIGEEIDKTFIMTANTNGIYLDVDSSYSTLKDFTVDGNAQTDGTGSCIVVKYANSLLLENIKVKNAGYYGMSLIGSYNTYKNIYAVDNYRHGIHPGGSAANSNSYNTYKDIYCWDNGSSGFNDSGGDTSSTLNNIYDNLRCWDNGSHGISLYALKDGSLINSWVSNNGGRGLDLKYLYNFTIENCSINSSAELGIWLRDSDNVNLSNVISKNNGTSGISNDAGICIGDTPLTTLSSCQFYDDRDPMLQDYGIKTEGTTKYIEITNCKLTPNEKYAILNHANAIIFLTSTLNPL